MIIYGKFWFREIIQIILAIIGVVVVADLVSIFPFDFSVIPNATAADIVPIGGIILAKGKTKGKPNRACLIFFGFGGWIRTSDLWVNTLNRAQPVIRIAFSIIFMGVGIYYIVLWIQGAGATCFYSHSQCNTLPFNLKLSIGRV
jgi:hypothetical protein